MILDPEKDSFLKKEYRKLDYVDKESVLCQYLDAADIISNIEKPEFVIFPFKFNLSQREAVLNVFKGNISVIEGPPGTGKTQTILNILANLAVMQNKSVAVVSNNNEAVNNVREKLEKAGYSFLVADLGREQKRKEFFENMPEPHVNLPEQFVEQEILVEKLKRLDRKLNDLFLKNNQKAELIKQIEQYQLEQKYFEEYYQKQNIEKISDLSFYQNSQEILNALNDISFLEDLDVNLKWLKSIQMFFRYGKKRLKDIDTHFMSIILELQQKFYEVKIKELKESCDLLEKELKNEHFQKLQEEHQQLSLQLFNLELYARYHGKINIFNEKEYKKDFQKFLNAFPVILSTTYSLRNSIPEHYLLDYVIVDEAFQVDLLSGALVLSCAKNVIIVGDEKQLPQIIDNHIKDQEKNFSVSLEYDYFQNSLISSILRVYGKTIPKTILKEHYRCHPKIIEFCNQRYYHNELIAFYNEEHLKVDKPLVLCYTALGHHMRTVTNGEKKGTYNNRELEVIQEEVLNMLNITCYHSDDIGITTPYRMQADHIDLALEKKIKTDTIHKFQGREKKLMILSTVIDSSLAGKKKIHFVDDPCMVNVAVSRAICQFVIVTDHDLFNQNGKEICALLKYIKYNTLDSEIIQSKIVSVFDLLYKDYSPKLNSLSRRLLSYSCY